MHQDLCSSRPLPSPLSATGTVPSLLCCAPPLIPQGQLEKLFFLFPDPHFKAVNHRRRIIQHALLTEYAHILAIGGIIYTITDVKVGPGWREPCFLLLWDSSAINYIAEVSPSRPEEPG